MNFGEIYNRIINNMYGNSAVSTDTVTLLQGSKGLIADVHRQVQQDYNYWFMKTFTYFVTVADTQGYSLPENYKAMIAVMIKNSDTDVFGDPLEPLGWQDEFKGPWQKLTAVEYPTQYAIVGSAIILYPPPSMSNKYVHYVYNALLDRPPDVGWTTYEDVVSKYAYELIINRTCEILSKRRKEFDDAAAYADEYAKAEDMLKREDANRQQSMFNFLKYGDSV